MIFQPIIQSGSPASQGWWQRPSEWLPIEQLVSAGDHKIVGLYAVFPDDSSRHSGNNLKLLCNFNYTIDWGDGVLENIAGNVQASHTYDYDNIDPATTYNGYRQVVVTITGNGNLMSGTVSMGITPSNIHSVNWLDVRLASTNITSINIATYDNAQIINKFVFVGNSHNTLSISGLSYSPLKNINIDFPNLYDASNFCNYNSEFDDLGDIVLNTGRNLNYFLSGSYVRNIKSITAQNIINANLAFSGSLISNIGNINFPNATDTGNLLRSVSTLKSIGVVDVSSTTTLYWAFLSTNIIGKVEIITSSNLVNCEYAFYNNPYVTEVVLTNSSGVTVTTGMFASCPRLAKLRLPGIKVSFSVASCNMNADALNTLLTDLADLTGLSSQTITITGNPGAATCDTSIATAKNWTVVY